MSRFYIPMKGSPLKKTIPNFSSIKSIGDYGLYNIFGNSTLLSDFDFSGEANFTNLLTIGQYGLYFSFYYCSNIKNIDFSNLTTIDTRGMSQCFDHCSKITKADFSNLTTVGENGLYQCFSSCSNIANINFGNLTTVGKSGMYGCFTGCKQITNVYFNKLEHLENSTTFQRIFRSCTSLENIYFNSLKTTSFGSYVNQFTDMMSSTGSTKTHTLHFPSNMETTIQGLTGYPLFGGTSGYVTLSFDLPATS